MDKVEKKSGEVLQIRITEDMRKTLSMFVQSNLLRQTKGLIGDEKQAEMFRLAVLKKNSKSAIARAFLEKALDEWLLEDVM